MFFNRHQQNTNNDAEITSQKVDDTNKIKALQDKRDLYIKDLININKNNLSSSLINKLILGFIAIISIILFFVVIKQIRENNDSISLILSLISLCVSLYILFLNNVNLIDNRKYENIKKINDIQYELSLCAGYIIENDFIRINNYKQNIQIFLDNQTKELYVKN